MDVLASSRMLLIAGILCISVDAFGQGLTPIQQEILRYTMAENGYLTKEMHREFWSEIKSTASDDEITRVATEFKSHILRAQELQKETWLSAKLSLENKEVMETARFREMADNAHKHYEESMSTFKGSRGYERTLSAGKERLDTSLENANRLLEIAADGGGMMETTEGPVMVDAAHIDRVLKGMKGSFQRASNLFDPDWDGER